MRMPHVSVIIPTHNRLKTLPRAVASVLAQSYTDYDLWVIDDASDDGTREYLTALVEQNPRVHILTNEKNSGVSFSRNEGIRASSGTWLAFLDSDDEWLPEKLKTQIALSQSLESLKLIHSEERWVRGGQAVSAPQKYKKLGGAIFDQCFELCRISPSTSLIHRELFLKHGYFREDFPVCEDFELWLRLTRHYEVGFCPEPLAVKYGGEADQLSARYHSMDYWRVLALKDYLEDDGLSPDVLEKLRASVTKKCKILMRGFEKHQNFSKRSEIETIMRSYDEAIFKNS